MKRCWLKNSSNLSNWKFAASASVRSQEPHCYKEIKPDAALASPAGHCACLTHIAPWSLLLSTFTVLQFDTKASNMCLILMQNKEIRVHEGTNQLGHHQQHGEEPEAHMSGAHLNAERRNHNAHEGQTTKHIFCACRFFARAAWHAMCQVFGCCVLPSKWSQFIQIPAL